MDENHTLLTSKDKSQPNQSKTLLENPKRIGEQYRENVLISQQVFILKKEISLLLTKIRCSNCSKMLAAKTNDGRIVIKCSKCKQFTVIRP